jgi:hypothetical protein|tara:strand:- start:61 stop:420 length:360 start_codon:yes stop_codon:yes gene_type:complete
MSTVNVNTIKNLNDNVTVDISTDNKVVVSGSNNFTVDSDGDVGAAGNIGAGTVSPAVAVDARNKTDAIALPRGTTAQRPTPVAGMMRWNNSSNSAELYNGSEWIEVVTDYIPSGSTILG